MKISIISAGELDAPAQVAWLALQRSNPALRSPYFCPEFTLAVGSARHDVRIALLEEGGKVTGFFPYQGRWGMGEPVGAPLSDHHGMVCAPGTRWDWRSLLRAARLSSWSFDHLPQSQAQGLEVAARVSPALDLSRGFAAYKAGRIEAGSRRVGDLDRRARKLAREVGPLRFSAHVQERAVFDTVLRLKSLQCQRTGVHDFFALAWTRAVVERIWQTALPHFAGRLSALYAGDTLVGAHLGMRSPDTWHWWFPVYEHACSNCSPGAQLLMQVAQAAADQGRTLLDLGQGDDAYKQSFADCSLSIAEGWVKRPALVTAAQATRRATTTWLRQSPLVQPLRPLWRQLRRVVTPAQV